MGENERNLEGGIEFNQEREPRSSNFRFYYNQDDGRVTGIILETKQGDIDLFPVEVKNPDTDEIYKYTPNLTLIDPSNNPLQQDDKGHYCYPPFMTEVLDSLSYTLESQIDKSFLDFLYHNLSEEELYRFLLEQTAVKISLKKPLTRAILTQKRHDEDKKKLHFQWPMYYYAGDGFNPKRLPIASQYISLYLLNFAVLIQKDPEQYNPHKNTFNLDHTSRIYQLLRNASEGKEDLNNRGAGLVEKLFEYHKLSKQDSLHLGDYFRYWYNNQIDRKMLIKILDDLIEDNL